MTSKFQQKLKRLHDSRVRALETEPRVFEATEPDPVENQAKPVDLTDPNVPLDRLRRAQNLEQKSKTAKKPKREISREPQKSQKIGRTGAATDLPSPSIGDRVKSLRVHASTHLETGHSDLAVPFLYEMVALQPDNTFALSRLVQYHRERGHTDFAQLFAERLKAHSPF